MAETSHKAQIQLDLQSNIQDYVKATQAEMTNLEGVVKRLKDEMDGLLKSFKDMNWKELNDCGTALGKVIGNVVKMNTAMKTMQTGAKSAAEAIVKITDREAKLEKVTPHLDKIAEAMEKIGVKLEKTNPALVLFVQSLMGINKDLVDKIKYMNTSMVGFSTATKDAATGMVSLKKNAAGIDKEARKLVKAVTDYKRADRNVRSITSSFLSLRNVLAGLGAFSVFRFGKAIIDAASDAKEAQNIFDVVYKDNIDGARAMQKQMQNTYGLSTKLYAQNVANLGAMMVQLGMDTEISMETANEAFKSALDISSAYNMRFEDTLDKVRAGIAGVSKPLQVIGIDVSVEGMKKYADTLGYTWENLSRGVQSLMRAQKIQNDIMKSNIAGDFLRTSDSYANSMRQVSQLWEDVKVILGEAIVPEIEKFLKYIKDNKKQIKELAHTLAGVIAGIVENVVKIVDLIGRNKKIFASLLALGVGGKMVISLGNGVKDFIDAIKLFAERIPMLQAVAGKIAPYVFNPLTTSVAIGMTASNAITNYGVSKYEDLSANIMADENRKNYTEYWNKLFYEDFQAITDVNERAKLVSARIEKEIYKDFANETAGDRYRLMSLAKISKTQGLAAAMSMIDSLKTEMTITSEEGAKYEKFLKDYTDWAEVKNNQIKKTNALIEKRKSFKLSEKLYNSMDLYSEQIDNMLVNPDIDNAIKTQELEQRDKLREAHLKDVRNMVSQKIEGVEKMISTFDNVDSETETLIDRITGRSTSEKIKDQYTQIQEGILEIIEINKDGVVNLMDDERFANIMKVLERKGLTLEEFAIASEKIKELADRQIREEEADLKRIADWKQQQVKLIEDFISYTKDLNGIKLDTDIAFKSGNIDKIFEALSAKIGEALSTYKNVILNDGIITTKEISNYERLIGVQNELSDSQERYMEQQRKMEEQNRKLEEAQKRRLSVIKELEQAEESSRLKMMNELVLEWKLDRAQKKGDTEEYNKLMLEKLKREQTDIEDMIGRVLLKDSLKTQEGRDRYSALVDKERAKTITEKYALPDIQIEIPSVQLIIPDELFAKIDPIGFDVNALAEKINGSFEWVADQKTVELEMWLTDLQKLIEEHPLYQKFLQENNLEKFAGKDTEDLFTQMTKKKINEINADKLTVTELAGELFGKDFAEKFGKSVADGLKNEVLKDLKIEIPKPQPISVPQPQTIIVPPPVNKVPVVPQPQLRTPMTSQKEDGSKAKVVPSPSLNDTKRDDGLFSWMKDLFFPTAYAQDTAVDGGGISLPNTLKYSLEDRKAQVAKETIQNALNTAEKEITGEYLTGKLRDFTQGISIKEQELADKVLDISETKLDPDLFNYLLVNFKDKVAEQFNKPVTKDMNEEEVLDYVPSFKSKPMYDEFDVVADVAKQLDRTEESILKHIGFVAPNIFTKESIIFRLEDSYYGEKKGYDKFQNSLYTSSADYFGSFIRPTKDMDLMELMGMKNALYGNYGASEGKEVTFFRDLTGRIQMVEAAIKETVDQIEQVETDINAIPIPVIDTATLTENITAQLNEMEENFVTIKSPVIPIYIAEDISTQLNTLEEEMTAIVVPIIEPERISYGVDVQLATMAENINTIKIPFINQDVASDGITKQLNGVAEKVNTLEVPSINLEKVYGEIEADAGKIRRYAGYIQETDIPSIDIDKLYGTVEKDLKDYTAKREELSTVIREAELDGNSPDPKKHLDLGNLNYLESMTTPLKKAVKLIETAVTGVTKELEKGNAELANAINYRDKLTKKYESGKISNTYDPERNAETETAEKITVKPKPIQNPADMTGLISKIEVPNAEVVLNMNGDKLFADRNTTEKNYLKFATPIGTGQYKGVPTAADIYANSEDSPEKKVLEQKQGEIERDIATFSKNVKQIGTALEQLLQTFNNMGSVVSMMGGIFGSGLMENTGGYLSTFSSNVGSLWGMAKESIKPKEGALSSTKKDNEGNPIQMEADELIKNMEGSFSGFLGGLDDMDWNNFFSGDFAAGISTTLGTAISGLLGASGKSGAIGSGLGGMLGGAVAGDLFTSLTGTALSGVMGAAMPVIGNLVGSALGGVVGGLFKSYKEDNAKRMAAAEGILDENTKALSDLNSTIENFSKSMESLTDTLITNLAKIPTLTNIKGAQTVYDNLQAALKTINLQGLSVMAEYKKKKWYGSVKRDYEVYDFSVEDVMKAMGLGSLLTGGKQFTDLTLDQMKQFQSSLNNITNNDQLRSILAANGIKDPHRINDSNFDEFKSMIDNYIKATERLTSSSNVAYDTWMSSFAGVSYQDAIKLRAEYMALYRDLGLDPEEFMTEINEMVEANKVLITVTQDVRKSFIGMFVDGASAGDAFVKSLGTVFSALKENIASVIYGTTFDKYNNKIESIFTKITNEMANGKVINLTKYASEIADIINGASKITTEMNEFLQGLKEALVAQGIDVDLVDEILGINKGTLDELTNSIRDSLKNGIKEGLEKGDITLAAKSIGDAIRDHVTDALIDSFVTAYVQQGMFDAYLKDIDFTGMSMEEAFNKIQETINKLDQELNIGGIGQATTGKNQSNDLTTTVESETKGATITNYYNQYVMDISGYTSTQTIEQLMNLMEEKGFVKIDKDRV